MRLSAMDITPDGPLLRAVVNGIFHRDKPAVFIPEHLPADISQGFQFLEGCFDRPAGICGNVGNTPDCEIKILVEHIEHPQESLGSEGQIVVKEIHFPQS